MARSKKMSEADLASAIDSLIADSRDYNGTDRGGHRELALQYNDGQMPDLPPMGVGRSSVVSRDVSDTKDLIKPGLMKLFFSSTRMVDFEPTRPEHEEYADLASDALNYIIMNDCDGLRHFNAAFDDGLLLGNGIVKHWWDDTPEYETVEHEGISEDEYRLHLSDDDVEEIEHEERDDPEFEAPEITDEMISATGVDPSDPRVAELIAQVTTPPKVHDVTLRRTLSKGRLRLAALPPEEFQIDRSATTLDETVRFCAHVQRKTRSELIEEGYPRSKVDKIPRAEEDDRRGLRHARDRENWTVDHAPDKSTEFVDIYECYVLIDYDGDGIAERRRVVRAGGASKTAILANEEWDDDLPFSDIVPDPKPHMWRGRGLYDLLRDIMRVKTVGLRGTLDNTYMILSPQKYVEEGAITNMDQLINPDGFGGVLIGAQGRPPPVDLITQSIAPLIMPLMEYMDGVAEKRTGASQRSMGLEPDALQNQTAMAASIQQAASHSKIEDYARHIANDLKRVFACCLRLLTKYHEQTRLVRVKGELKEVDPTKWDSGMDVTINTGLGTGSRERDLAMLSGVVSKMEMVVAQTGPMDGPITIKDLFGAYSKMAEAAGMRNPDQFFPAITDEKLEEMRQKAAQASQAPNPEMMKAQTKLQADQAKFAADMEMEKAKLQFQMQADVAKFQAEAEERRERMQLDAQFRAAEAQAKLQFQREEAAARLQLLQQETQARIELARAEATSKQNARMAELNIEAQLSELKLMMGRTNPDPSNIPGPV